MSWAKSVMNVKGELEQIAGVPVHLRSFNWDFSVGCRIEGFKDAVRIDSVKYKDPRDGKWYVLDGTFDTEAGIDGEALELDKTSPAQAREMLRDYVRKATGKLN